MKKMSLCTLVAFAVLVSSAAIAQAGASPQGTQGSSPGMSQPGAAGQQQPGGYPSQQHGASPTNGQTDPNTSQTPEKREQQLKGWVQEGGGEFDLMNMQGYVAL